MAKKLPINEHDKEFAKFLIEQIDTEQTRIENEADVLDIIREYKNFTLSKIERKREHTEWATYEPVIGLKLIPGICHIYGAPDTLKTYLGINIANWFANNTHLSIVYIDAENKLWKRDKTSLKDGIYLAAGRSDTHNLVRKLVTEDAFQVIIVDTIVALSRYEDFLRNIIKSVDTQGIYLVLLNQTYSHNYEDVPAGNDTVPELAYKNHKILGMEKEGSNYYIRTDTGIYVGFLGEQRIYSVEESLWYKAIKEELIQKKEDKYYYKGLGYSSKEAILIILSQDYKNSLQMQI